MNNLLRIGVDYDLDRDTEGRRVWVTGADGSNVGRFDKQFGIDVHRPVSAQARGEPPCLHCTHGPAGLPEWNIFREQIKLHFGIDVPADFISFEV